ncbi:MAG: hypothetical protein JNK37_01740 [Verrucomicrobiales bacterium]|nr:hypothetical protein [Verrucomicrobiales bacterium]
MLYRKDLLAMGLALFVGSCEKPPTAQQTPLEKPAESTRLDFPVDKTLTDNKGRRIEASIVGRTEDRIYIVRRPDGLKSEFPIASLSESDQEYVLSFRIQTPPAGFFKKTEISNSASKKQGGYVQSRLDAIERLELENRLLLGEIDATTNSMLRQTKLSKVKRNTEEIARLKSAIDNYRLDNP